MSSIEDFQSMFDKEKIEIIKWDHLNYKISKTMFPNNKLTKLQAVLNELNNEQLNHFPTTEGVNWDDIRLFVWSLLQEDEGNFNQALILIDVDLNKENTYHEPNAVVWRRFLINMLDLLNTVQRYTKRDLNYIKENS